MLSGGINVQYEDLTLCSHSNQSIHMHLPQNTFGPIPSQWAEQGYFNLYILEIHKLTPYL